MYSRVSVNITVNRAVHTDETIVGHSHTPEDLGRPTGEETVGLPGTGRQLSEDADSRGDQYYWYSNHSVSNIISVSGKTHNDQSW